MPCVLLEFFRTSLDAHRKHLRAFLTLHVPGGPLQYSPIELFPELDEEMVGLGMPGHWVWDVIDTLNGDFI